MDFWSNTISQLSVDDSEARCFTQWGLSSRIPTHRNAALQDALACFWSTYSILFVRQGPKNTALVPVAARFKDLKEYLIRKIEIGKELGQTLKQIFRRDRGTLLSYWSTTINSRFQFTMEVLVVHIFD